MKEDKDLARSKDQAQNQSNLLQNETALRHMDQVQEPRYLLQRKTKSNPAQIDNFYQHQNNKITPQNCPNKLQFQE